MMDSILTFGWTVLGLFGALIGIAFLVGLFITIVDIGDGVSDWCERNGWN